jgi:hypothetical protein
LSSLWVVRTFLNEGTTKAGSANRGLIRRANRLVLEQALGTKVSDLLGGEYDNRDRGVPTACSSAMWRARTVGHGDLSAEPLDSKAYLHEGSNLTHFSHGLS